MHHRIIGYLNEFLKSDFLMLSVTYSVYVLASENKKNSQFLEKG